MKAKRIYFEGLNEIRAIAALSVVWHHIELYKYDAGLPSLSATFVLAFLIP